MINNPLLSDKDRDFLRDGLVERVANIVREQAERLINRMATFGMTAWYKVEPRYGHVELTLIVGRTDAQGTILSRMFNVEILTSRRLAVGVVQRDLETMVRTLFFGEPES